MTTSRGTDIGLAVLLFLGDLLLLGILLFGVLVSGGFSGTPDRAAVQGEAAKALWICAVALLLSAGAAGALRARITCVTQIVVLGAGTAAFAVLSA